MPASNDGWKILCTALLLLTACFRREDRPGSPTPPNVGMEDTTRNPAQIDAIKILISESAPLQAAVRISGNLNGECARLGDISQSFSDGTFEIYVEESRPTGQECPGSPIPFEQDLILEVENLPSGQYDVEVNGMTASFLLDRTAITPPKSAVISGLVWHDLCNAEPGDQASEPDQPPGCIETEGGDFLADGVPDTGEPGIGGVLVDIGEGACPSSGLAVTMTDNEGLYLFSGLDDGVYCVGIDVENPINAAVLDHGVWSYPAGDTTGDQSVTIGGSDTREVINFGWDYGFGSTVSGDETFCFNSAKVVENSDRTDYLRLQPGESFTKIWDLVNSGSCTWTSNFALVFIGGELLGGEEAIPIGRPAAPGDRVRLSLPLVAPLDPGIYVSDWMIQGGDGRLFGLSAPLNKPFRLVIQVSE